MRCKVLTGIPLVTIVIISCNGLGISSELDFGDSSPKLIGAATQYRSVATPYKHLKREDTKKSGDFEGIGVVCVSGGCNTTKSDESKDSIQTDVVVHVKTSVDVNKNNKSTFVDDTPDVPVVVGTAGTSFDDQQSQTFINQKSVVLTDFGDTFSSVGPSLSSSGSPSISSSVTPSFVPSYPSYSTPILESDNVYVHKSNLPAEPRVDINIKTLPPVTLTMTDDGRSIKDIRYKTNGIELRVPYFEPSYHNHYFGENSPPQLAWYPKSPGFTNTEYKPKATWKPPFWSSGIPHKHIVGSANSCPCNSNQPTTGLQWHPIRRVYQEDPGSQINDKLAPLN